MVQFSYMKFSLFKATNQSELPPVSRTKNNIGLLLGYSEPPHPADDPGYEQDRVTLEKLLAQRPEVAGWIEKLTNKDLTDQGFMKAVEESRLSLDQDYSKRKEGKYSTISFHNIEGRRSLSLNIFENGLVYFSASI